jgi:hypothetical protein
LFQNNIINKNKINNIYFYFYKIDLKKIIIKILNEILFFFYKKISKQINIKINLIHINTFYKLML